MKHGDALKGATAFTPLPGVIVMAAKTVEDLEAEMADILAASQAIVDKAEESGEDISDDDLGTIEANKDKVDKLKRQIEARKTVAAATAPQGRGRQSAPEPQNRSPEPGRANPRVPATARDSQRHNFSNMGEFALACRHHALKAETDGVQKLLNAATTYGNESSGADGGFLIPPEFSREIWTKVEAEENLMNRCAELVTGGNSMSIPKDETNPAGTSGIRVYWDGEAASLTATKPVFENSQFRLVKLTALAPVTDETLEDALGFESWIKAKVPGLMAQAINTGIVSGSGVGKPLGILSCIAGANTSVISVAKETSQPADTVWFSNINKMWSRMYAPWRRNAIWLINQDIEPSLHGMAFQATGASSMLPGTSAVPAYLPMNGLSGSPYATLMGRPVVPIQACSSIGDQGDIILVDLSQYWVLKKAGGMKTDTSIHLYFDQSITAFRFIFRINGQPAWSAPITPQNGSNTLSWAVVLDAR